MQHASVLRTLLALGVLFVLNTAWAQEGAPEEEVIEWRADRPLRWSDFRFIKRGEFTRQLAVTAVKHSVRGYIKDGTPDFEVKVLFVKTDSWALDTLNAALLKHEQVHFDIGEIYRRKIVERIESLRKKGEKQKAIYRYAIQKLLAEFRKFSQEYDLETHHGTVEEAQKKWENEIAEALNRLQ